MLTSCDLTSSKNENNNNGHSDFSGVGNQIPVNVQVFKVGAEINDVKFIENVTFRGKQGIAVNFHCRAYGFKGYPLYFYAYVLYENDCDFVVNKEGNKVYGFEYSTIMYDAVQFEDGITINIPYTSLPSRYHGELCIDIVIIDGFDNIIATKPNNRLFYSTL